MIQALRLPREIPTTASLVTEDVSCGVCGQSRRRRLFTESYQLGNEQVELAINRCVQCRQIYVSPRLTLASTDQVYRVDSERTISHHYCWSGHTSSERFGPLLNRLRQLAPAGRLLDVGCGAGHFLESADELAYWELAGVEPCASAARQAQQRLAVSILPTTLELAPLPPQEFSVITLLGVLEHLHDPVATLLRARTLLRADGILAVYVPNFHYLRWKDAGPLARLRCGKTSCLAPQEHLFHFTPQLLVQLLTRSGFEVVRLDVGRPFVFGPGWRRWIKERAFGVTVQLHKFTGIHLGGLEAIARLR